MCVNYNLRYIGHRVTSTTNLGYFYCFTVYAFNKLHRLHFSVLKPCIYTFHRSFVYFSFKMRTTVRTNDANIWRRKRNRCNSKKRSFTSRSLTLKRSSKSWQTSKMNSNTGWCDFHLHTPIIPIPISLKILNKIV